MWADYLEAPNLMVAQMWRDIFDGEGLPANILPHGKIEDWSEYSRYRVMIPVGRHHVADEIMRKL